MKKALLIILIALIGIGILAYPTIADYLSEKNGTKAVDTAAAAVSQSPLETGRVATDVVVALDRTLTTPGTYPVVLVSYIAACQTYTDPATGALVKAYLTYVVSDAGQQAAAGNAGSAPLSSDLAAKAAAAVSGIQ